MLEGDLAGTGEALAIDEQALARWPRGELITARRLAKRESDLAADTGISDGVAAAAPRAPERRARAAELEGTSLRHFDERGCLPDAIRVGVPEQGQGGDKWGIVVVRRDEEAGDSRFIVRHAQQLPLATSDNFTEVRMDMENGYRVLLRWRCVKDESWELETGHGSFESGERAALFANGLSACGVARLRLARGHLAVQLNDGRCVGGVETVATWRLLEEPGGLPESARFERVTMSLRALSDLGLDGAFEARSFVVLDPTGSQMSSSVEVDLTRQLVRVTVGVAELLDEGLFTVPRA